MECCACNMKKLSEFSFEECPPVLTTDAMRALDAAAKKTMQAESEIDAGYELMKEAGAALFARVQKLLLEHQTASKTVAVLVGGGNNGGDGLVLAKLLLAVDVQCIVFSLAKGEKFKNEAGLALNDFLNAGGVLNYIENPESSFAHFGKNPPFALVVDAMLGNGASGELRPAFAAMARLVNDWNVAVLAADAPTGYDSSEHVRRADCVVASETMLFGYPRLDAYVQEGGCVFGKANVARLRYDEALAAQFADGVFLATENMIDALMPVRNEWGDKRAQGSAMIVAGSANMPGAAALCTGAALRSGAGLVTLATPKPVFPIVATKLSEPVFLPLAGDCICPADVPQILHGLRHAQSLAIGPGLSTAKETGEAVLALLSQVQVPMVIDADALNILAASKETLKNISAPAIFTPHVREFARLFGELPAKAVEIPAMLRGVAKTIGKVIVLKGAPTFVALPNGCVYVVPVANSGMAKGGSGDVLTGILASLLSLGMDVCEAAVLGVLLHQRAGRIARTKKGAFAMLPSDVIDSL